MVCRKFKHVALVIVISSAFVQSHAMDLMQVYLAAQSQDASLLATRAAAAAGRERIPQAKSQLYPNISANAIRNNNRLTNSGANLLGQEQTTNSQYRSGSESVTLRQPIYRSAALAQYFQAQAQVEDSESMLMQEEQNLAVRVGSAYFEALLTDEQLALVLAQRVSYITQLDSARKSFQAGFGTRTDIDEAQARLDMTYAQEIEARQNVDFTLRQLQAMLTQPIDKLVPLDVSRLQILPPEPADLETWLDKVYRNSPQLKSLQAQVEVAHQEVEKNKAGHLPTLDAIWQWTRSESDTVSTIATRYVNRSVGVQLNVPLFSGGYVNSAVRQATASHERALHALEAGRRDTSIRVHREFRGMTESIPKIKAYEQALRSADQVVLSSKKSYLAGSRTVLDVLNAEQQRMAVVRDLAQVRYMYLISKIRLLALAGEADEKAVAEMNQLFKKAV